MCKLHVRTDKHRVLEAERQRISLADQKDMLPITTTFNFGKNPY